MRKIKVVFLLIIGLSFCLLSTASFAIDEIEDQPGGKNLLNLKTVYQTNKDYYGHSDDYMIPVTSGKTYTLVMDEEYVNACDTTLSEFEYEEYPSYRPQVVEYVYDEQNHHYYVEFVPLETHIIIYSMPVPKGPDANNYNVMLYEGDYASFSGFEPYVPTGFVYEEEGTLAINYDDMLSTSEITSLIRAFDGFGHEIDKTVILDTFSNSDHMPGAYEMVFEAQSNSITRTYKLLINVYDETPPVIEGPDELTIEISNKIPDEDIHQLFTVTDNVDKDVALQVETNTYKHGDQLKTYYIVYSAIDASGNKATKEVAITLVDTTPPEIKGPLDLYIYTTDIPYTEQDILDTYTAVDDVDGDCEVVIINNEYAGTTMPGIYEVEVSTSDTLGNTASMTTYIHVIDNRGPSFMTDELIIETTSSNILSTEDVIEQFQSHMQSLNKNVDAIHIKYSEYENNEDQSGDYYVYMSYQLDGQEALSRVLVHVDDDSSSLSPYYWFGVIPIVGIIVVILKKKKMF